MPPRIVSLLPSTTETLRAWGLDPVACTRFCEQPDLPTVGGTKDPDLRAVMDLRPDLVVMDTEENRREDHDELVAAGLEVLVTEVHAVEDVAPTLRRLAQRCGRDPATVAPRADGFEAIDPLGDVVPGGGGTVFVPIWRRPWVGLGEGTYGSSLLSSLGFRNVLAGRGRYPALDPDPAALVEADLVLAPSEPYPFGERHRAELAAVAPVVFVDGRDLFWWGVRTTSARRRLAAVLSRPGPEG